MERVQTAQKPSLDRVPLFSASNWYRRLDNAQISLYPCGFSDDCRDRHDGPVFCHRSAHALMAVPTMPKKVSHEIRTHKF